ncbi:C40 family peptidase [Streptomyces meridianus]|uniref:NlpC/P60 family protein n=1 Tax=Streptomyces meridianus TaxID=2938945 RepID=A0ABT0X5L2_9ACTN|nr:C40 family peptidase [Streptomyces meridianus]MCM2577620.1 NlpC/P60 family protein [Streptomyces meridianus]
MASHRKPRQRPSAVTVLTSPSTWVAPMAFALAGSGAGFGGTAHADPRSTPTGAEAEADKLYEQAEAAGEKYNGAKEKADRAQEKLDDLRDEAARRTEKLNTARNTLGSVATAQYRAGSAGLSLQLALSASPDAYLERTELSVRAADRQAVSVSRITRQLRGIAQARSRAGDELRDLRAEQAAMRKHKRTVGLKLAEAERLVKRLTAEQRDRVADGHGGGSTGSSAPRGPVRAPNERAALAVGYAYEALGKPYVWGATGPSGYDCSGLTLAAWKAAGVSLPRTSYTQINAGQRVPRSQLAPGDLVFFYSGISHVGLYIGGGKMIHAPRPGAPVRIAPIDLMPFAGAARPA